MATINEVYDLLVEIDTKLDILQEATEDTAASVADISNRLFELEMPTGGGFELES